MHLLRRLARDKSGATAIEYGLVAALVSVGAIGALTSLGQEASTLFGTVSQVTAVANNLGGT